LAAVLAAGIAVTATGCAPTGDGGDENVLTVVSWKSEDTNDADMKTINDMFRKEHPEIKLEYTWVDNPDWLTYNNPRFAAGTAADVLMLDRVKMIAFASQGFLADLSDESWVPRMMDDLTPFNQYDGKTYQFNAENIPLGLYANMDLLAQAGIDEVPQTWPEFIDALETLKAAGIPGFSVPNKGGWMGEQIALELAANHVPAGWVEDYDAGEASFTGTWDPVVDAFKELFAKELVDPALSLGLDPNVDAMPEFQAGKWAFMVQGAWSLTNILENAQFEVTLNAFPGGGAGTEPKAFNFVGSGWGINAEAKNPEAARTYLEFLASPEIATIFLEAEAGFSTLKDVPSPSNEASKPIEDSFAAGNVTPSVAQMLNDPDAEFDLIKGIENIFLNPTAPASDTTSLLNELIEPTQLK
jgi:raffinose/stachyose/melibiose transport system substrate-binding protein